MQRPLVSVICLCYNQSSFVCEAIESVLHQTYQPVELIVVDDASTDTSVATIRGCLRDHPEIVFLPLSGNVGNCTAFNRGLALCNGDFIIDLAADDILMERRIEIGVTAFAALAPDYGIHFSDAELIDEKGGHQGFHSDRFPPTMVPQGDIYADLVRRYFISSPTMMIRRAVLVKMGGYDESLAYEDFDFWIRSSRDWKYAYAEGALVKKRIVADSMSHRQYQPKSRQLMSTFNVCEKIKTLNRTPAERSALGARIRYEMRRAVMMGEWGLVIRYLRLWIRS